MNVTSCFRPGSERVVGTREGILFGGSNLLQLFFDSASRSNGGSLRIASPFVTNSILTDGTGPIGRLPHRHIRLSFLTSSEGTAAQVALALGMWPWAHLRVSWSPRLHAKLYLLRGSDHDFLGLIGSTNLTSAALRGNAELGLMIRGSRNSPLAGAFERCDQELTRLQQRTLSIGSCTKHRDHTRRFTEEL